MKSACSAVLVACLIASHFARCATTRGPRQIDAALAYAGSPTLTWSRVGEIVPGAAVTVTTRNGQPGRRYFVTADRSRLVVLNLTNPALPPASTRVLRDMAAQHPENLAGVGRTGTFAQDNGASGARDSS
jgi:hypothetical protein